MVKATDIAKKSAHSKIWSVLDEYRGEGEFGKSRQIIRTLLRDSEMSRIDALIECITEHPEIKEEAKSTLNRIVDIITE